MVRSIFGSLVANISKLYLKINLSRDLFHQVLLFQFIFNSARNSELHQVVEKISGSVEEKKACFICYKLRNGQKFAKFKT